MHPACKLAYLSAGLLLLALTGCESPSGGPSLFKPSAGTNPDEEIWAIRCITLEGPERFRIAENYARALKAMPGVAADRVQVLSDDDGTAIFYGRYRREVKNGREEYAPDPLKDLERIRSCSVNTQDGPAWPFIFAALDLLPLYRSAHPEWNLENADGYWALHIAVFYNTETMRSRRSAAEEYCRILREQGESAYFHHGPVNSSVYIGTFPRASVQAIRKENPLNGTATTVDEIVDPRLRAVAEKYPHSLHNGHVFNEVVRNRQTGEVRDRLPAPSFPVVIPKAQRGGR